MVLCCGDLGGLLHQACTRPGLPHRASASRHVKFMCLLQAVCDMISEVWDQHKDALCVGIDWELFRDRDHMLASYFVCANFLVALNSTWCLLIPPTLDCLVYALVVVSIWLPCHHRSGITYHHHKIYNAPIIVLGHIRYIT